MWRARGGRSDDSAARRVASVSNGHPRCLLIWWYTAERDLTRASTVTRGSTRSRTWRSTHTRILVSSSHYRMQVYTIIVHVHLHEDGLIMQVGLSYTGTCIRVGLSNWYVHHATSCENVNHARMFIAGKFIIMSIRSSYGYASSSYRYAHHACG